MTVPSKDRSRGSGVWWLSATMCVCLAHLWWLNSYSFWFDELFTAASASEPTLADAFERWFIIDVNNPPLYGFMTVFIGKLFGIDELTMRLPSWLFVTASCLLLTTAPIPDIRTRRLAGLLLAATPFALVYSQEARVYGLLLLGSTIALLGYMKFTEEHRLSPTFVSGVLLASLSHYFGLLFGGMLLLLAFVTLIRRGNLREAAKAIPVGLLCWAWVVYVVAVGKAAELAQPFWIQWSLSELARILMSISSATLALLALGARLWHRRPLSTDLWWSVAWPALAVCAVAVGVSLYRPLIIGRYFIVLAPTIALLTADVLIKAWEAAAPAFSARVRYAAVGLIAIVLAAENVVWMERMKWGPYQNYRGVAEYVLQDAATADDQAVEVSIVLPSHDPPVRLIEQHYFNKAGQKASRLHLQLIDPTELAQRAAGSHYLIAMHWPESVAQARRFASDSNGFVEIDIPSGHKSMTFLAKRAGAAPASSAPHRLSSAGAARPIS